MGVITIPYKPRLWAQEFHNSKKRWNVLVMHRRCGKTVAVVNHLQRSALQTPNSSYAYIAPTYKQAKRIAWEMFKKYSREIPGIVYNESELIVKYPNGSLIYLFGSDNVDSLRGIALWGGAQDESSQQPSNLFSEVISKCLADHLGYWIWMGTPKGKNEFYKTYEVSTKNEDYFSMFKTIDDTLENEEGETVDNLRVALEDDKKLVAAGQMTAEEFEQEWYCSFEAAIKGAYYARQIGEARKTGRIKNVPYDEAIPVHTVWDLGIGSNLAVGFYQKSGNETRMIDYWQGTEKDGIPQAIKAIKEKPYTYGKHFAPHDVKATEQGTGLTKIETASKLGINFEIIPSLSVDDGINAGKLLWSRLWVNDNNCSYWLDAMAQYHQEWDELKGIFNHKPCHDWTSHPADIHRYAAVVESQMSNEKQEQPYKTPIFESISEYEPNYEYQTSKIIDFK